MATSRGWAGQTVHLEYDEVSFVYSAVPFVRHLLRLSLTGFAISKHISLIFCKYDSPPSSGDFITASSALLWRMHFPIDSTFKIFYLETTSSMNNDVPWRALFCISEWTLNAVYVSRREWTNFHRLLLYWLRYHCHFWVLTIQQPHPYLNQIALPSAWVWPIWLRMFHFNFEF